MAKSISSLPESPFFSESSIDEQLNSTYVIRDVCGKIVGSVRAEVGDDDVVYIGPLAVAPSQQVSTYKLHPIVHAVYAFRLQGAPLQNAFFS